MLPIPFQPFLNITTAETPTTVRMQLAGQLE